MSSSIAEEMFIALKCDFLMALNKCTKDEIINNHHAEINPQSPGNEEGGYGQSLNYEFVQNQGDIYINFPDIMVWVTSSPRSPQTFGSRVSKGPNSYRCLGAFKHVFNSLEPVDENGRKSLDQFIKTIVTYIYNNYNTYMDKLSEASVIRPLLQNSLNILGLEEHSDEVYKTEVRPDQARDLKYKFVISDIKLINMTSKNRLSKADKAINELYSIEAYLKYNNIINTDHVLMDKTSSIVEWDTCFDIVTNLLCGYCEFRVYKVNQDKFLEYKLDQEEDLYAQNEPKNDIQNTRTSNPFDVLSKSKSNTDSGDVNQKQTSSERDSNGMNVTETQIKGSSDDVIKGSYQVNNEDIQLEIVDADHIKQRMQSVNETSPQTLLKNTNRNSLGLTKNVLKDIKSPIREATEEEEASMHENATHLMHNTDFAETSKQCLDESKEFETLQQIDEEIAKNEAKRFEDQHNSPVHIETSENPSAPSQKERNFDTLKTEDFKQYKILVNKNEEVKHDRVQNNCGSEGSGSPFTKHNRNNHQDGQNIEDLAHPLNSKDRKSKLNELKRETVFAAIDTQKGLPKVYVGRTKVDVFQETYLRLVKQFKQGQNEENGKQFDEKVQYTLRKELSINPRLDETHSNPRNSSEDSNNDTIKFDFEFTIQFECLESTDDRKSNDEGPNPYITLMSRCKMFENRLDKYSQTISELQNNLDILLEPFHMVDYDENQLSINYMNIGHESSPNNAGTSFTCANTFFPSRRTKSNYDLNQSNVNPSSDNNLELDSDDERNGQKLKNKWRCKCSIL